MSLDFFNSTGYYLINSTLGIGPVYLGDGARHDSVGALFLSSPSYSSDNWQIFYQNPVFLIRNYDWGADYQLGITADSPALPGLQVASGELTQQWNITPWDDGSFRLTNMFLGSAEMLRVSVNTDGNVIPVMGTQEDGSHWGFERNPSAGTVSNDMLQSVSLQAPSSTSTSSSASTSISAISSTPAKTTAAASKSVTGGASSNSSSSPNPSSASSQHATSKSLSGGAIAGIVVAAVSAVLFILGLLLFVRWRRRKHRNGRAEDQASVGQQHERPFYNSPQEADTRFRPSELATSNEREEMQSRIVEIPG